MQQAVTSNLAGPLSFQAKLLAQAVVAMVAVQNQGISFNEQRWAVSGCYGLTPSSVLCELIPNTALVYYLTATNDSAVLSL